MIPRRHDSMLILLLYDTIIATLFSLILSHRSKNSVDNSSVDDSDLSEKRLARR
jgi:hypothetical protein